MKKIAIFSAKAYATAVATVTVRKILIIRFLSSRWWGLKNSRLLSSMAVLHAEVLEKGDREILSDGAFKNGFR